MTTLNETSPQSPEQLSDNEQEALDHFRDNPRLLRELLSDPEFRAEALRTIFDQAPYKERGMLSLGEFSALAENETQPCLEVVPLRQNPETGITQVLLYTRPETDPWWPGELHSPGTKILGTDLAKGGLPFERILGKEGELKGGVHAIGQPEFVDFETRSTKDTGRGPEVAPIFYIAVEGNDPVVGSWVDVDDSFPSNAGGKVIDHHVSMIKNAAEKFKENMRMQKVTTSTGTVALHDPTLEQ